MLIPQSRLDEGGVKAGERTLVWFTAGNDEPTDDWTRMTSFIPENTQASQIALQFDTYIPEAWVEPNKRKLLSKTTCQIMVMVQLKQHLPPVLTILQLWYGYLAGRRRECALYYR